MPDGAESRAMRLSVSNHGDASWTGHQLYPRTAGPILDAVGVPDRKCICSGIRSGQDVLKAHGDGGKGQPIRARVPSTGSGAMGQAGGHSALEVIPQRAGLSHGALRVRPLSRRWASQ